MAEISSTGDQMLTVLEAVAQHGPITVAELATSCGINRTVVHRLLATLNQRAYVLRTGDGFVIGPMLTQLAEKSDFALRAIAMPQMTLLATQTGETVVLHALDGFDAVVVEQALGDKHVLRVQHRPGSRHPLVLGASGRAILAFQPATVVKRNADRSADPDKLVETLGAVRTAGYAISHDELQLGVHGIAVPLHEPGGVVTASLGILVPVARAGQLLDYASALKATARRIEAALRAVEPGRKRAGLASRP